MTSSKPLADRIALVTGASRGIGYATALALARNGAHVVAIARTVGGLEELDDAIRARRRHGHAGAARSQGFRRHRPPRRGAQRALRAARHPGRQCRHSRAPLPARPCRAEGLGRCDRRQRHRQLASDPLHGPAAAAVGGRPRGVHHLRRRRQSARLLGALRDLQGGARRARAHLCGGDGDDQCARQPVQPGPDPHPHARGGDAGRRPGYR